MNITRFMALVMAGWALKYNGTKVVIEGDKEKPVEVTLDDAVLVSPYEVADMQQNEDKNIPQPRRRMDGTVLTTPVSVPVPSALYNQLKASGALKVVARHPDSKPEAEPEKKAA